MTRKDYQIIARAIATFELRPVTKAHLAEHISNYLLSDNPDRFDPDRFIAVATQEVPE